MPVKNLTAEEFKKWRTEKHPYLYIDVRNKEEWDEGHFEEAINIPLHLLPLFIKEKVEDIETTLVVGCAHGGRSALAAQKLLALGYNNVYNLLGGYCGYSQS